MTRPAQPFVAAAVLAVGAAGVFAILAMRPSAEARPQVKRPPLVEVMSVEPGPYEFMVRAHGTVVPRREGDLVPQVSGSVQWVSPALAAGGFFDEGEPLLRIDPADAEVAVESARAAVARAQSEAHRARRELSRQRTLAQRSVASQTNLDDAQNAERVAAASLREAEARRVQAERDLARTEITAPYAGRVRSADIDVGEFVARGTSVAKIYAVDFAEVRLPIPDSDLGFIDLPLAGPEESETDQPRVLLTAQFGGQEQVWEGRVVRTEGEIDPRSRMVHVVAEVEDPYGRQAAASDRGLSTPLAAGLFVEANIYGRRIERASELPRIAVREDGTVLVVDENDVVRERPIEVLRTQSDRVIVGEGLGAGERVAVGPSELVVDGMPVRTLQVDASSRSSMGANP
ncbi:efflux RND transporter periplasmic adaptor subunit [Myxococcota bacterium]|nr:efflux RND transporter periplasmic adaptor subunit [Myxococcota bacterium]